MQKVRTIALLFAPLAILGSLFFAGAGCEKDKDTDDNGNLDTFFEDHPYVGDPRESGNRIVVVTPETANMSDIGEQALFSVTGGEPPYNWDTANANGTISPRGEDTHQAVYQMGVVADNTIIVWDRNGDAALATINSSLTPPVISPSTAALQTNQTSVAFEVSGGKSPYLWTIVSGSGSLAPTDQPYTVYTRGPADPPNNYLIKVTDANGAADVATITQY